MTSFLLSAVLLSSPAQTPIALPAKADDKTTVKPVVPEGPPAFELLTNDQSTFRVAILDSTFDITTAYGVLTVPVKEIRKLEIGLRLTEKETVTLKTALAQLTGPDRKARLAGREMLVGLGEKALPALRRVRRTITDPEALAGLTDLETKLSSGKTEVSDRDSIVTDGSTFTGRIGTQEIKVLTGPFGEQKLKITDLVAGRSLTPGSADDEGELVTLGPSGMLVYQGQTGKVLRIRITGAIQGTIYGTGTYTLDSFLPMAAIHTGVVRQGESAVIKIKIVASLNQYTSTVQNGIQSMNYGIYQPGAYEILGKATDQGQGQGAFENRGVRAGLGIPQQIQGGIIR